MLLAEKCHRPVCRLKRFSAKQEITHSAALLNSLLTLFIIIRSTFFALTPNVSIKIFILAYVLDLIWKQNC